MWGKKKLACVPLASDPSIRRSYLSPDALLTRPAGDEVVLVGDIFAYTAKKYGDKTACWYRDIVNVVEEPKVIKRAGGVEEKKSWMYYTLSEPKPVTYKELDVTTTALTAGFVHLGFTDPKTPVASRPRVSIYADTSLHWQLIAQACGRLGHTFTTAYTTLGGEGLLHSLVEPDVELIYCGEGQVELVAKVVERAAKVRYVIYDGEARVDSNLVEQITKVIESRGGKIITFTALEQLGRSQPLSVDAYGPRPTEDDLFCIMYTSGSTGPPKGVMLTNKNIVACLAGSYKLWGPGFHGQSDLLLAYLPLAHILEQFLEYTFYLCGVPLGYASVKTLLDDSVRGCKGDLQAFRPTCMGGVPAVWEMIRKGMMKKIGEAPAPVQTIFELAVKGKQTLPWPLSSMIDKVLFARVKQAVGGRLRLAVCGGGQLSPTTQMFLSTVLAPMMQGYGLTETVGMTTITTQGYWSLGSVGVLGPSTELKLADCPELGYVSSHDPPQGEIWLRGSNVFKGYFKRPDLDAEAFTGDGWFKTGDIGQWDPDGTLRIIDRLKNLIKLQNGEYIALDRLESIYKACDLVMMICIAAPPYADRPVALVYPHEGNLRHRLTLEKHAADGSPEDWAEDPKVTELILRDLQAVGKQAGLQKAEMLQGVVLTPEEWSPDNGLLTPAMKLARPVISKRFEKEIGAAYGK